MEQLIDSIRAVTHRRAADVRLTIFIVLGALKAMLPEVDRNELAVGLPMELRVLLLGKEHGDDPEVFDELALVDVRMVELVCRLLAAHASPQLQSTIGRYVFPRLCALQLGSRTAMESTGVDAFGPATLRAEESLSVGPS